MSDARSCSVFGRNVHVTAPPQPPTVRVDAIAHALSLSDNRGRVGLVKTGRTNDDDGLTMQPKRFDYSKRDKS